MSHDSIKEVYIGLGGNIGDSIAIFHSALQKLSAIPHTTSFLVSSFYRSKPESDIPQNDYTNAVCRCNTTLSAPDFLSALQEIEIKLGKLKKPKNAPRIIDLDLLFFSSEFHHLPELMVPHPSWNRRLFVLIPLSELVDNLMVPLSSQLQQQVNIKNLIDSFPLEERTQLIKL